MSTRSLPPPSDVLTVASIGPRPLLAAKPPPYPISADIYPLQLPSSSTSDIIEKYGGLDYRRTTHIIPACESRMALSRKLEQDYPTPTLNSSDSKATRGTVAQKIFDELQESRSYHKDGSSRLWNQSQLYISLHRFQAATRNKTGVTIIVAHANGFNKEVWEPAIERVIRTSTVPVDEVWSFEAVNHGESAVLNKGRLGDVYDWADNARDILNFLCYFLPSASGEDLPTYLSRVSFSETKQRLDEGFSERQVIGIGHSFGGCTTMRAAIELPQLYSSIVMVDPVIAPALPTEPSGSNFRAMEMGSLTRRLSWKTREEAVRLLKERPFFAPWDSRVLDLYVRGGTYDDAEQSCVTLKTSGFQEAITFIDTYHRHEVWELLGQLDTRLPVHWIVAAQKLPGVLGPEELVQQTVWRHSRNSSNVLFENADHLIVQEHPDQLGDEIVGFLARVYGGQKVHTAVFQSRL